MSLEPPFAKTPKAQQQVTWDIATILLSLLSALASARDEILESVVNNEEVMRSLFTLISSSSTPTDILIETFSCLMILSEDNLKVSQLILADQSNCFRQLMKLKEGGDARAVHACGVLHNVFSACEWHDGSPGQDGASDAILVATLSRVLERTKQDSKTQELTGVASIEILQLALQLLASIATDLQGSIEKTSRKEEEWNGIDEEMAVDEDEGMKQLKLDDDIEADGDSDKDGVDEDEDEDDEDDTEMGDDEILADMELVTGLDDECDEENSAGIDELPTLREYIQKALPQLIRISNFNPTSDDAIIAQGDALSALNNIAWTLACFDFKEADNASIARAWTPAAKRIWTKVVVPVLATDTADVALASIVASIAFAVTRALQASTPLRVHEQRKFMSLYKASKGFSNAESDDPFQSLGVKCIGVLGQLARDPAPIDLNREIGIFLITILSGLPDTPAQDAVEALNELMEIYGDEDAACDEVFWKNNFLKQLEEILPKAKSMAKLIDKREHMELRARADEAILNLGRFIQYKKKTRKVEKTI